MIVRAQQRDYASLQFKSNNMCPDKAKKIVIVKLLGTAMVAATHLKMWLNTVEAGSVNCTR